MKRLWLQAQKKKKKRVDIINHRYLRGLFEDDFMEKIKWLQTNLQKHRLNNFMGSLLQHHTLKSTKYMSCGLKLENKVWVFFCSGVMRDGSILLWNEME
jgi:hypothetical protein